LITEFSFPILIWFQRTKLIALMLISALHIGIGILIPNVTFFTTCMLCSFWIFVPEIFVKDLIGNRISPK